MSIGLDKFFFDIWGEEEGTVFLATKKDDLFKVTRPQVWPAIASSIEPALRKYDIEWDTYYTPGIFKEGSQTKAKENGWRAKCLWVDLDGYKDGSGTPQAAREQLAGLGWLPEPTYELETSSELANHWYWVLDQYYPAEVINDYNRRLAYYLNGDTACWDISHVMRPPTTHNHKEEHKIDGVSPVVSIVAYRGTEYNISEFDKLPSVKDAVTENIQLGEIPSMTEVFMHYPWDKEHTEIVGRSKEHFWDEEAQEFKSRGNAMVRLAYFGAEIGMPDEYIFAVLASVELKWGKFEGRRDRKARLIEMIMKARKKYPAALITGIQEETIAEIRPVYGFRSFLKSEYKFDWIYEGFIPKNTINFISAAPGAGKSRFIMQLMKCLALGEDFLHYKLVDGKPRKVMMFSLEMGGPILKKFAESLEEAIAPTEEQMDILEENFKLIPQGEVLALSTPEGEAFFKAMLDEYKPEIVFIDAMGSLDHDELKEAVAKSIMNTLKKYLNSHGVTFYLVHHNKKADTATMNKPPTLNSFYGNTYGATDAASIVSLWKNPNSSADYVELHELKTRIGIAPDPIILDARSKFTYSIVKDGEAYVPPTAGTNTPKAQQPSNSPASEGSYFSPTFGTSF
jgi:KaiC/GvpD/RAD55 family RecA-like ATPase